MQKSTQDRVEAPILKTGMLGKNLEGRCVVMTLFEKIMIALNVLTTPAYIFSCVIALLVFLENKKTSNKKSSSCRFKQDEVASVRT